MIKMTDGDEGSVVLTISVRSMNGPVLCTPSSTSDSYIKESIIGCLRSNLNLLGVLWHVKTTLDFY